MKCIPAGNTEYEKYIVSKQLRAEVNEPKMGRTERVRYHNIQVVNVDPKKFEACDI